MNNGHALVLEFDLSELTIAGFKRQLTDFDPDTAGRWQSTAFRSPDETTVREAEIAVGFDEGTQSYNHGSETYIQQILFVCCND